MYAAHFVVEAKKAGFNVSESMLNKLTKYLSQKAKEQSTFDYIIYLPTGRTIKKIANKEILYSLYVLAMDGEGDIATMNYYKARPHLVSEDMRYLLAGSYALMGRWNSYNEIVPNAFTPERTDRLTGGSFDSDIRANAIMLNVLLEAEPANKQIPVIIKYLSQNADRMYSTQERSFAFLALGKAASRVPSARHSHATLRGVLPTLGISGGAQRRPLHAVVRLNPARQSQCGSSCRLPCGKANHSSSVVDVAPSRAFASVGSPSSPTRS